MLRNFRDYIEKGPFEAHIERGEKYLNWFCWAAILFAVVYFVPVAVRIIVWGPK